MPKRKPITFDAFALDTANELLWKGTERIFLRPKTFALLKYLVERPGQLVTKQELLNALWQNLNIGDEALKHCVNEIRRGLDDNALSPCFIETVFRRGYRFIGYKAAKQEPEESIHGERKAPNPLNLVTGHSLVGRSAELAQLNHLLAKSIEGIRQVAFISGDQGIGKTSLVDAFLGIANLEQYPQRVSVSATRPLIARGQCIKSHGSGEAYMPILQALVGICSPPGHKTIIDVLRRHAPLWLVQMPSLVSTSQLRSLQNATLGATRERMLREMAETLEALTVKTPLILVLEDLQWSDYSTLDLLSYWAQRRGPARLLLIATYRPMEISAEDHPLRSVREELQSRQLSTEIDVPLLDKAAIGGYLSQQFPSHKFPGETAQWLLNRTGGNPLFLVNVLDHLHARGLIVRHGKHWELTIPLEDAEFSLPPTIQQIIERQLERCTPQEQRLLKAGSVEGVEFSIEGAAAALGDKAERIEARCQRLAERRQFLQLAGVRRTTTGKQNACYRFNHALYQNTCYQLLPDDLRVRLHKRLAEYIEENESPGVGSTAARLAMHFDRGKEPGRALMYCRQAADNANSRYAGHEAHSLSQKGLNLLKLLPERPELIDHEMGLQIALGTAMMNRRGIGAEEVSRAFSRARELFDRSDHASRSGKKKLLFSALNGLWHFHWVRAEYVAARGLAADLMQLADDLADPKMRKQAHHTMGIILMDHGEFAGAYEHLSQGTGVVTRFGAALLRWNLGFPNQAIHHMEETIAIAIESRNPENCIFANQGAARIYMARREYQKTLEHAQSALDLANNSGLVDVWTAPMRSIHGWALGKLGQVQNGLDQTRQAMDVFRAIRASNLHPLLSGIHAEISMEAGRIDEGLDAIKEGMEVSRSTGMHHYDAEIYRLKGELLRRKAPVLRTLSEKDGHFDEAASCFEQSIEVAQQQQSKSMELRATTSMARLLQKMGRYQEAQMRLKAIYDWFTEGFDTLDLIEARELLEELS
jgi:DNA-binding winged helix-turn-helix (wHTH) protein/tetratricopeptide (TPR) repeat protein